MARARAPLALIAAAAMLASHWVAYVVAAPDAHDRAHLLDSTGHAYWPFAMALAIAAGVLGLGSFVSRRLTPQMRASKETIFRHSWPRFLVLQVGGFVALEATERVLTGHGFGLGDIMATTFLAGIALQVLAAVLSALLLVGVALVVRRLARTAAVSSGTPAPRPLTSLVSRPCLVPATGAHTLRGPPAGA